MKLGKIIATLIPAVLACGLAVSAQSFVGDYQGRVTIGDTSGTIIPVEFVQSIDVALHIDKNKNGTYSGTLSFRRPFLNPKSGHYEDLQGPLDALVIDETKRSFQASATLPFTLGGRTVTRIVTISGTFTVNDGQCLPYIQDADYFETIYGLVFRPWSFYGIVSLSRAGTTEADAGCVGRAKP